MWTGHLHEGTAPMPLTLVLPGHSISISAVTGKTLWFLQQNRIIKSGSLYFSLLLPATEIP